MSLKLTIKYYLQKHGYLSLRDLEQLCKQNQKKLSNGERRLRELMNTEPIQPEKNKSGAIIGYFYQSGDVAQIINKAMYGESQKNISSPDWWLQKEYQRPSPKVEVKQEIKLF